MKKPRRGLVQVYTGNGKGKTTAALGLAFRASGHGLKTYIVQFMKGDIYYGELGAAEKMPETITIRQMGRPDFVDKKNPAQIDIEMAEKALKLAKELITSGDYDLVVLDEINVALDFGLIRLDDVLELINKKPPEVELILTGRYAPKEIIEMADLVTEMVEVKHPYNAGVEARVGIER
ncbi:MAG: cob(I)yrinic acid a,c-diamide adenosyltransferase [Deltaproteobacteria bacterium]|uniref:Cob(I)yrinic acid a,c-diamide adenosyltransferase n=1 Tax=Candidatus Zymogenus saltonus TaxID=2844893 RepID=A0A9D8KAW4_9DELT|nr:cob(I)yrinic acid a,c-diamide adenosyltransferase [Candidatus Zymogenus saltonus]